MKGLRIRGEGPQPCRLMIVGEAPGYWENEEGRPFVGKSGRLLNTYLAKNNLDRSRIFITNVYPYWPGEGDPTPTSKEIAAHAHHLLRDLSKVQPSFILAAGRVAAEFFGLRSTLEVAHGLPFLWTSNTSPRRSVWIVPCFHPAAALRNPESAAKCFYDVRQFSLYANSKLRPTPVVDLVPSPEYRRETRVALDGPFPAIDTEGTTASPYCLSYSTWQGKAKVVLATDIKPHRLYHMDRITLHNSMWDLPVLRAMGLEIDDDGYEDTILMARLLLLEPAGLKDLALRHCGMVMREYNEVVGPHFKHACLRYLDSAQKRDWGKPDEQAVRDKKTGKYRIYRPHSANNRLNAITRDIQKGRDVDIRARWSKLPAILQEQIEAECGPFPISHPSLAPLDEIVPYAARDADATRRIKSKLWPMIVAAKLTRAYKTDLHAIPMFERMAHNGMQIDPEHFSSLRPGIVQTLAADAQSWCARYNRGVYLNLASGDQVAAYLFDRLHLRPIKQTKGRTRYSVDENTLELLKDQHRSIPKIIAWKKLHTNLTFVDRIPKWMRDDHRIYPNINTQGTVTGRPSTSDPNLLNVPVRSELGKQIRMGFVTRQNWRLLSVDLSQIELRIGAHLSHDKEMIRAFKANEDLHQKTANSLGLDRYTAKTTNFGIFYGMSFVRLRSELIEAGITRSDTECKEIISDWFKLYRGVRSWLDDLLAKARRHGYVRGLSGRLRYLPNLYLTAGNPLRAEAERHAGNFPVQEGAGYVIKRAMWRIWRWIKAHPEYQVEPLLQVYDELLFEVPKQHVKVVAPILKRMMVAESGKYRVPLLADTAIGKRWGEL